MEIHVKRAWIVTAAAAFPSAAQAHGEQVLFLPIGQLLALLIAGVIAWRSTDGWKKRCLVMAAAIATAFACWFLPGNLFGVWSYTVTANFLMGLVPPVVIAALVSAVVRRG